MSEKHVVTLNDDESAYIETLRHKGKVAVRRLQRAHILRFADEAYSDDEIKDLTKASIATIERVRAKFVRGGLMWALNEKPRGGAPAKLDGKQEAFLIALACTLPPTGHDCWTMQLLADRLLTLKVIETEISEATVRRALKKTILNLGCMSNGAFRPSVPNLSGAWKISWTSTPSRIIRAFQWSALMNAPIN
jgi:transposase